MSKRVTNRQLFFIIFLTLTTYTSIEIPKIMAQSTGRTSWLPIIITSIIFGIVIAIIAKLNNKFQGRVFFDYCQEIVGKFFTYIIVCYYIIYFFIVGSYLKLNFANVLSSNFLPNTPKYVFIIFSVPLFAYIAYKGITNMARLFEIYGILFILTTLGICSLMFVQGEQYNVLPLFNPDDMKKMTEAMKLLIIPYGGIEILFIFSFTVQNKKAPWVSFLTILFIGIFYIIIVESTIYSLGINNTIIFNDSFIEAIKITDAPVIERVDVFYLTFGLSSLFCGMSITFIAIVEYACKIFSKVKRHIIVIVVAIILVVMSLFLMSVNEITDIYEQYLFYLVLLSSAFIPITIATISKFKK